MLIMIINEKSIEEQYKTIVLTISLLDFLSVHLLKPCLIFFIAARIETFSPPDVDNLIIPLSIILT